MRPETSGQTETSGQAAQTDAAAQWSLAWRGPFLLGLVTVVLGLIVTARPTGSLNAIAVLIGVLMIVSGIYHLATALDNEEHERVWRGIAGLLFIVTGVVLIRHLRLSLAVIGLIVGFTWIAQGVSSLLSGISGRPRTGAGWSVFFGVISLIAGIVVVSTPISSLGALTVLMGIWFVVMGVMEMLSALVIGRAVRQTRAHHGGTYSVPGQRATEPEPRDSATTPG